MSAASPPSLLISPDRRRRLQQRHEEAQRLAAEARPDYRQIHDLLAECVRTDPGNILYLDALLANLRRRNEADRGRSWLGRLFGGWARKRGNSATARQSGASHDEAGDAADLLWSDSANVAVLLKLAAAAGDRDFDEVELRYLTMARDLAPDDPETLRMLARGLTRQGRFEDALGPWCAVAALVPNDAEAAQATHDLRGTPQGVAGKSATTSDAKALIDQARSLQEAGDFAGAERCLAQAQAVSGAALDVIQLREDLRLAQGEHRLMLARRRAASDPHPKAQALVGRLADEQNRVEIEILNMQVERLPRMAEPKIELARRLKRAGNFSGAMQRLDEALRLRPDDPGTLILMGECWQHLRQFDRALEFYEQAVAKSASVAPTDESVKLAHYRAAVLASALGQADFAREHFQAVLAVDPAYKDARERLDKMRAN